mgnify:CR=1 FL=1
MQLGDGLAHAGKKKYFKINFTCELLEKGAINVSCKSFYDNFQRGTLLETSKSHLCFNLQAHMPLSADYFLGLMSHVFEKGSTFAIGTHAVIEVS